MDSSITYEKILDPNFINAELIGSVGAEKVVTISDIDYKDAFNNKTQKLEKKWSLIFKECKPLILNKTNTKTLMKLFGTEPKNCIDKKITLYVVSCKVAGQQTTGIRIKAFEDVQVKCEDCGQIIKAIQTKTARELVEISKKNFNKALCNECMKKIAKENK